MLGWYPIHYTPRRIKPLGKELLPVDYRYSEHTLAYIRYDFQSYDIQTRIEERVEKWIRNNKKA